jgi:predicted permease
MSVRGEAISVWKGVRARVRALVRRRSAERELDDEIAFHIEMETEKHLRRGLSPEQARRQALLSFGGMDRVREQHRDVRGFPRTERLWQDVRYAARGLWQNRGFTAAAVLTLALGMGANAAAFGVVDALLYRQPAGVGEPEDAYRVRLLSGSYDDPANYRPVWTSYPQYEDLRDGSKDYTALAAYRTRTLIYGEGESAREIPALSVTSNWFEVLRVRPRLGRFPDGPDRSGEAVVVLGYDFWQREFGGDVSVLGRSIVINPAAADTTVTMRSATVIGVAPSHFRGVDLDPVDVFVPIGLEAHLSSADILDARNTVWLWLVGRLPAGLSPQSAGSRFTAMLEGLVAREPDFTYGRIVDLMALNERFAGYGRDSPVPVWLLGVTAAVLLIACANVSNLLLARGAGRRRELAIRAAVGASRGRIMQQLLTESLLLAVLGGVAGLWIATMIVRLLHLLDIPRLDVLIDSRVVVFTFGIVIATSILVGLVPALRASRTDIETELKAATPRATYDRSRLRAGLTMAQIAISIVLLVNAGLFVRSLRNVQAGNATLDADRLLHVTLRLPRGTPAQQSWATKEAALERLLRLPDVVSASINSQAPFASGVGITRLDPVPLGLPEDTNLQAVWMHVGPGYFQTVGLRLLRGRSIEAGDRADGPAIAVVNSAMARLLGDENDVVGRCVRLSRDGCIEIIGVVDDSRFIDPVETPMPAIYDPLTRASQDYFLARASILVRVRSASAAVQSMVQRELAGLGTAADRGPADVATSSAASASTNVVYADVQSMGDLLRPKLQPWRVATVIFSLFGGIAFLLAAIGLYGVIAYLVAARRLEFGIRMALGAGRRRILGLVMGEGVRLVAAGGVAGLAVAFAVSLLLENRMYGVQPTDPITFSAVAALVAAVAIGASFVSARRAARADSIEALRVE